MLLELPWTANFSHGLSLTLVLSQFGRDRLFIVGVNVWTMDMLRPPNGSFPIAEAQLVGLFMESVAYGIFLVTFGLCMRILLFDHKVLFVWKAARRINWCMLVVAVLMFIFATMDVAFGLRHNLDAFIYYQGPGGPNQEFSDLRQIANVMKSVDYVFQTAIGDAILIYRCLVVYNRSWHIIIIPMVLWALFFASGIVIVWIERTTVDPATLDYERIKPWLYTLVACTLTVNVLVTSMIVWRIRRVRSRTAGIALNPHRLSRVIRTVLDSGLMYTICVIIFFGTTLAGSNAQYGVSDVIVQVIGITFNLIIIRVDKGTASSGADCPSVSGSPIAPRFSDSSASGPFSTCCTDITVQVETVSDQLEDGVPIVRGGRGT